VTEHEKSSRAQTRIVDRRMNEEEKVLTGLTAHQFTSISPERIRFEVPDLQAFAAPLLRMRLSQVRSDARLFVRTSSYVFRAVQATNLGRPLTFLVGGEFTCSLPFFRAPFALCVLSFCWLYERLAGNFAFRAGWGFDAARAELFID
jgi:hypothetical protein